MMFKLARRGKRAAEQGEYAVRGTGLSLAIKFVRDRPIVYLGFAWSGGEGYACGALQLR